jgi:quinol monooxygenase YgiN
MIKVLIKRRFKEGKKKKIRSLLNEFRVGALHMPGYISGVTMTSLDDQNVMLVIGTWEKMEHWNRWKENPARKAFEKMLEIYQEGPTIYEEYIVGTSFSSKEKAQD